METHLRSTPIDEAEFRSFKFQFEELSAETDTLLANKLNGKSLFCTLESLKCKVEEAKDKAEQFQAVLSPIECCKLNFVYQTNDKELKLEFGELHVQSDRDESGEIVRQNRMITEPQTHGFDSTDDNVIVSPMKANSHRQTVNKRSHRLGSKDLVVEKLKDELLKSGKTAKSIIDKDSLFDRIGLENRDLKLKTEQSRQSIDKSSPGQDYNVLNNINNVYENLKRSILDRKGMRVIDTKRSSGHAKEHCRVSSFDNCVDRIKNGLLSQRKKPVCSNDVFALSRKLSNREERKCLNYHTSILSVTDNFGVVTNQVIDESKLRSVVTVIKNAPKHLESVELYNNVFKINPVPLLKQLVAERLSFCLIIEVQKNKMECNKDIKKRDIEFLESMNVHVIS